MKSRIPFLIGVFAVMALSNAVVPVLPSFAEGTTAQAAIYSAYFLGAFLMTIPAGLLSDRVEPVWLIRTGLGLTLLSGVLLVSVPGVVWTVIFRLLEGTAAGLFITSSFAWVNEQTDHVSLSGYFMATLNGGLVAGLLGTGWLVQELSSNYAGIIIFSAFTALGVVLSVFIQGDSAAPRDWGPLPSEPLGKRLIRIAVANRWLWFAAIVLVGATGVVTALYPELTGLSPKMAAWYISIMNIGTILAVFIASRFILPPIRVIRAGAAGIALSVLVCYVTPAGFPLVGIAAGIVMIAIMAFLSESEVHQGTVMGLFTASSYGGMAILPFMAGVIAETSSFLWAFGFTALLAGVVAVSIGRCSCEVQPG